MIDKQLCQELDYTVFAPVFKELFLVLEKLDSYDIRLVVGNRVMDRVEDQCIRLVLATYKQLET